MGAYCARTDGVIGKKKNAQNTVSLEGGWKNIPVALPASTDTPPLGPTKLVLHRPDFRPETLKIHEIIEKAKILPKHSWTLAQLLDACLLNAF